MVSLYETYQGAAFIQRNDYFHTLCNVVHMRVGGMTNPVYKYREAIGLVCIYEWRVPVVTSSLK